MQPQGCLRAMSLGLTMQVSYKCLPPSQSSKNISFVAHPDWKHTGKEILTPCKQTSPWLCDKLPWNSALLNNHLSCSCLRWVRNSDEVQQPQSVSAPQRLKSWRLERSEASFTRRSGGWCWLEARGPAPPHTGISLLDLLHRKVTGFQGQTSKSAPRESHILYMTHPSKSPRTIPIILFWLEQSWPHQFTWEETQMPPPSGKTSNSVVTRDMGTHVFTQPLLETWPATMTLVSRLWPSHVIEKTILGSVV